MLTSIAEHALVTRYERKKKRHNMYLEKHWYFQQIFTMTLRHFGKTHKIKTQHLCGPQPFNEPRLLLDT